LTGSEERRGGDDFLERLTSLSKWKKVIPALPLRLYRRRRKKSLANVTGKWYNLLVVRQISFELK